jgi:CubicO group peptidase (beta-lactamase class C family)
LAHDVGAQWQYGVSTDVLGLLVERVSGVPFPDFMQNRIFAPLGMVDTAFYAPKEKASRVAVLYGFGPDDKRVAVPSPARTTPPKFASGGGGLYSTADDYLKFARMLLGGGKLGNTRLLSRQSVALMTSNWLTPEQRKIPFSGLDFWGGQGFGLGVAVVDDIARYSVMGMASAGSFYWPGAFGTWWIADPKEDMILIYMVQNAANLRQRTPEETARMRERQAQSSLIAFQTAAYRAIDA